MELNDAFATEMYQPIYSVWNAIAGDMDGMEMTNRQAIEVCIDADRLETFSSKEDHQLLRTAITEHGYKNVVMLLTKNIILV